MGFNKIRSIASRFRRRGAAAAHAATSRSAGPKMYEAMESRVLFTGTGLAATYFDNPDFTGPSASRLDAKINFDWQSDSPVAGIAPDTYSVRWTGQVQPRYSETYTFRTTGNDGVRLWVNGQRLVDDWNSHPATVNTGRIALEAGRRYDITMEYYQNYGTALAKLEWASATQPRQVVPTGRLYPSEAPTVPPAPTIPPIEPGAGTGLQAAYFHNPDFTGFAARRVDSTVDFDWQSASPVDGVVPDTYSVSWTGQVQPRSAETYTFHTTGNDGIRLWVNGQALVDDWNSHPATENSGRITLEAGKTYDIRMEYYQNYGTALAKLEWSSASQPRQVIPATQLYPAAGPELPPVPDPTPDPVPVPDPSGVLPPPVEGDWNLIFRDEFAGSALDPVWHTAQYWDNDYTVVGHGELQVYDETAVSVSDGMLHLTAREEAKHGMPYVSGLVQTGGNDWVSDEPRFSFTHGYMEVRAKLPSGQGLWPAIWMMPASYNDGNGELDVLEVIGSEPNVANFNLHRNGLNDGEDWVGPDFSEGFHTFGVDWQPDHVSWYVDGVERARMTDPALICPEAMYPILNVAVGGDWPGAPDATTAFPATMDVDYVRVWQRA